MFENEDMPFLLGIGAFFTMIILLIWLPGLKLIPVLAK